MASSSSDSDSSNDDNYEMETKVTLESINKQMTIKSSLISNYAAERDGIIRSFKIYEKDFQVVLEENEDEIVYKAVAPTSSRRKSKEQQQCFGYIRWSRQNGAGVVEVMNRQATLQPWHLDMGGSSKQNDGDQAGAHGEGLKVALLILLRGRQNHAVKCFSGGFSWTFNFTNERRLVAYLRRLTPSSISKARGTATRETKTTLLPIVALPNEDIQFFIGGKGSGRNDRGYNTTREEVTRETFKEWTSAALFLQDITDENIIRTRRGDLITDDRFSGNIYLKGLLLKTSTMRRSASITGKLLRYGYSFADGETNRERQTVATANDESMAILAIWDSALAESEHQNTLIRKLHDLLNSDQAEYADVANAECCAGDGTRTCLKKYLLSGEQERKWFYSAQEKNENHQFEQIVQGLDREAVKLTKPYWSIMANWGFRTAAEEEQKRFLAAEVTVVPQEPFAKTIYWLVRAGLASCSQTQNTSAQFVKAGQLGLESFFDQANNQFKIHERWLTEEGAQEELGFVREVTTPSLLFNTAKRLAADAILQMPLANFSSTDRRKRQLLRKQAVNQSDQRIWETVLIKRHLSFNMMSHQNMSTGTMTVKWDSELGWAPRSLVAIQLHLESSCSVLKDRLLTKDMPRLGLQCIRGQCHMAFMNFRVGICEFRNIVTSAAYFGLLQNTSDPDSIVVMSDSIGVIQPAPATNDQSKKKVDTKNTFVIGDKVDTLDIMPPRDWYHGTNSLGTEAVVGIKKDEDTNASEPSPAYPKRKRRTGPYYFMR